MNTARAFQNFKNKYGYTIHPNSAKFKQWAATETFSLTTLFPTVNKNEIHQIDLSTSSAFIGGIEEFNDLAFFQKNWKHSKKRFPQKLLRVAIWKSVRCILLLFIRAHLTMGLSEETFILEWISGCPKTRLCMPF